MENFDNASPEKVKACELINAVWRGEGMRCQVTPGELNYTASTRALLRYIREVSDAVACLRAYQQRPAGVMGMTAVYTDRLRALEKFVLADGRVRLVSDKDKAIADAERAHETMRKDVEISALRFGRDQALAELDKLREHASDISDQSEATRLALMRADAEVGRLRGVLDNNITGRAKACDQRDELDERLRVRTLECDAMRAQSIANGERALAAERKLGDWRAVAQPFVGYASSALNCARASRRGDDCQHAGRTDGTGYTYGDLRALVALAGDAVDAPASDGWGEPIALVDGKRPGWIADSERLQWIGTHMDWRDWATGIQSIAAGELNWAWPITPITHIRVRADHPIYSGPIAACAA